MDELYSYVFRAALTEESLDKAGRLSRRKQSGWHGTEQLERSLALDYIDEEFVEPARQMATVYSAIAAFENAVRDLVRKQLIEAHAADWWEKGVSESIRKKAESRKEEEEKIKWHSKRGEDLMAFTDFSQLYGIICQNWQFFEDLLQRQQWVHHILDTMERSRNVIMHSGSLPLQDVERIGSCIRDWMKQTGG